MRSLVAEVLAAAVVVACLVVLPVVMLGYGLDRPATDGRRVIALTGIKSAGVWTAETVNASNHGFGDFAPATVRLDVGEKVLLRLTSADVTHTFYVPDLGLGPVQVEPGHVVEVEMVGTRAGVFEYYCTSVCGECHYFMRGHVIVGPEPEDVPPLVPCLPDAEEPSTTKLVEHGAWVFRTAGCVTCHGERGRGGVQNPNYEYDTVPALNLLAERLRLFEPEEVYSVIGMLASGFDVGDMPFEPMSSYRLFVAQYDAVVDLIKSGNHVGKKDVEGPEPPLHMPSWEGRLSDRDVEAVIAYALSEYPWEEEE